MKAALLCLLISAGPLLASQQETMRVTVAKSLLQTGMDSAIDEKRAVTGKVANSDVSGTALIKGSLKIDLVPNEQAAGLKLSIVTDTESHTVGVNHPRHGITVNLRSTAYTPLSLTEELLFKAEGIVPQPADIKTGKTTLYYEGLDVTADNGLNKASAEQEAWKEAWRLKAHNEDVTSERVANEMRDYLTKSVNSFNHLYQKIFYEPVFSLSGQNRSLHLSTTNDALTATILSDAPDTLTPAPAFDGGNVIAIRMHESLATRYFSESVTAKSYNEEDLEEFFITHAIPSGLGKYREGDAQIQMTFCPDAPVTVAFETLQIGFTVCAKELSFNNEKAAGTKLTMTYTSRLNPDGSVDLVRLEDPALENVNGLSPATLAEVQKRFGRIFPEQVSIPQVRLSGQFGKNGDLVTHRADLGDGWLVTELYYDPAHKPHGGKQ